MLAHGRAAHKIGKDAHALDGAHALLQGEPGLAAQEHTTLLCAHQALGL